MIDKTITIQLPNDCGKLKIMKQIDIDESNSLFIEIYNDENESIESRDNSIFCYFQDRTKTVFNPREYAYIESTQNHYSIWYPKDPNDEPLHIYVNSFTNLSKRLNDAGLTLFCRVHESYIVNIKCISTFDNKNVFLHRYRKAIPMGKHFKDDFIDRTIII